MDSWQICRSCACSLQFFILIHICALCCRWKYNTTQQLHMVFKNHFTFCLVCLPPKLNISCMTYRFRAFEFIPRPRHYFTTLFAGKIRSYRSHLLFRSAFNSLQIALAFKLSQFWFAYLILYARRETVYSSFWLLDPSNRFSMKSLFLYVS